MSGEALYGVENSNRPKNDHWGKNQFNSSFPVALCCHMRDHGIRPVYITVAEDFSSCVSDERIEISDVFGTKNTGADIRFEFETAFDPFSDFVYDEKLDGIDLVTKDPSACDKFLRPLEVKLTVVPDSTTCDLEERLWASELVLRPVTCAYAALSIYSSVGENREARKIVESSASQIDGWDNAAEILSQKEEMLDALRRYIKTFHAEQKPLLIHPIWKTMGKTPELANNCFDVFVWSDLALCKAFIDKSAKESGNRAVSRSLRESARMLRCLNDLHTKGKVNIQQIYKGMSLGKQTDKAVALSGTTTSRYMQHPRLVKPAITKETLKEIILNGGQRLLSPERRFDATIYFTCEQLFNGNAESAKR